MVSWCSENYATEGNATKVPSKCLQKCFEIFSFCFFFLLIIGDRVGRKYLCNQDLWIRVLQITQNNISHPKSLMINYKLSESVFLSFCADSSMLLFENCREVGFQAKYAIFVLQIMQIYKSPYTTDY